MTKKHRTQMTVTPLVDPPRSSPIRIEEEDPVMNGEWESTYVREEDDPLAQSTLRRLAQETADLAQKERDAAANELVGELGMKAAGGPKVIRSFEGSPLFGSAQQDLFGEKK